MLRLKWIPEDIKINIFKVKTSKYLLGRSPFLITSEVNASVHWNSAPTQTQQSCKRPTRQMETDSGCLCLHSERLCHKKNTQTQQETSMLSAQQNKLVRLSSVSGSSLNGQQNNNRNILLSYWKQLQSEKWSIPIKKLKRLFSEQKASRLLPEKELKHRQVNIFPCGGREVKGFAAVSSFVLLATCTCIKHAHANSYAHKNTTC